MITQADISVGLCECGCGQRTSIAKFTSTAKGWTKGRPLRFVLGHIARMKPAVKSYPTKVHEGRATRLHRLRAEAALGRPLSPRHPVHHVDGTKSILSPLVICEDAKYHCLLHVRTRVLRAGGNPNTDRICCECRRVLLVATMFYGAGNQCRDCKARRQATYLADPEIVERRRAYDRARNQTPERRAYMQRKRARWAA